MQVNEILEYADYVFCNEDEAKCFAETNSIGLADGESFLSIAIALAKWKKINTKRGRVAVIT